MIWLSARLDQRGFTGHARVAAWRRLKPLADAHSVFVRHVSCTIWSSARHRTASMEENMAKQNPNRAQSDAVQRDPDEWVTGDESMTGPQASYLKTLATEAGEEVEEDLTKAEASKKIDELQERTGRGRDH
jgi:hypothetical protein